MKRAYIKVKQSTYEKEINHQLDTPLKSLMEQKYLIHSEY